MAEQASISQMRTALGHLKSLDSADAEWPAERMEHRLGTRMPISLSVWLSHAGQAPASGRMLNMSLSGAYVQTSAELQPLARVGVLCERSLPDTVGTACVTGFVTRVSEGAVALEWLDFAPAAIRHLMMREEPQAKGEIAISTPARRIRSGTMAGSSGASPALAGF
jgi:hypothetical protein